MSKNLSAGKDRGQHVRKSDGNGGVNEQWLRIHQPWKSQQNKDFYNQPGQIIDTTFPKSLNEIIGDGGDDSSNDDDW